LPLESLRCLQLPCLSCCSGLLFQTSSLCGRRMRQVSAMSPHSPKPRKFHDRQERCPPVENAPLLLTQLRQHWGCMHTGDLRESDKGWHVLNIGRQKWCSKTACSHRCISAHPGMWPSPVLLRRNSSKPGKLLQEVRWWEKSQPPTDCKCSCRPDCSREHLSRELPLGRKCTAGTSG